MKFWFFTTDGAPIVLLLMFCSFFCVQGASAEANDTDENDEIGGAVEIPCSLDDENRTDCNSSSPVSSGSPELWTAPNLNSSDVSDALCLSDGCSTNNEQGVNTTSHEFSPVSASDNFSEIVNQTETNLMTEHFTITSTARNETTTPCPLEGCLESNRSEPSEVLAPSTNSSNMTENFETTPSIITTFGLNETVPFRTSNVNDSSLVTPEATEISNFTKMTELTAAENETMTTEDHKNFSFTTMELSNTSSTSHTVEAGNSTEANVTTEHPLVTDEEKNISVSVISSTTESFYNTSDLVENNTTVADYPVTRPESLPDTTNATSLDNTTLFHTPSVDNNATSSLDENTQSSTNTSITDTTPTTESPSVSPQTLHIIVEIRSNCSDSGQQREIALLVAQLLNATLRNDYNKGCNYLHNISLSIMHSSIDLATIRRILSERLKGVEIARVMIYDENGTPKDVIPPPTDNDITQSEMVLYITLGVSLGAIFLIALAIICFKCCRRRPSKPVDLDVPHLNLRLEDYTLTRIPRPNTCYLDYFRGPIVNEHYSSPSVRSSMNAAPESNRGMVQPFDTSVVPLEDAKKLDQLATSPNRTSCPSTPLRTFGRKDWKNGDKLIYENVISSSTEKLHPDFYKYGYAGTENPTFAA